MSDLELSLLGPVHAILAGQAIKFRTRKAQALLIYLATEASRQLEVAPRREGLLALLWPDYPEESARHSLRTDLYYLKKAIPGIEAGEEGGQMSLVLSDNRSVQINPAVAYELDMADFGRHLILSASHDHPDLLTCAECEEQLRKAVELYRGDFLADFYLPDSAAFEV